jgi:hypothetical protein
MHWLPLLVTLTLTSLFPRLSDILELVSVEFVPEHQKANRNLQKPNNTVIIK